MMPDHDLHLKLHGTSSRPEGWAAIFLRSGFNLSDKTDKQSSLTLQYGGDAPTSTVGATLRVSRSPCDTPETWCEHFGPFISDYSRDSDGFLDRHLQKHNAKHQELTFDLAGFAEGLLKGHHEQAEELDNHGRPIARASLLERHHVLDRPVLDDICRQFSRIVATLTGVEPAPPKWYFMPTLDLDSSGLFRRRAFPSYLRQVIARKPEALPRLAVDGLRTGLRILKDPHLRHRQIGEILEGLGFHGAIFTQTNRWHRLDNYVLHPGSEMVRDLKAIVENRFHDVGLHSSYATLDRGEEAWRRQWRKLRATVGKVNLAHRSHYLRFPVGRPWPSPVRHPVMDSSLGYGDREGFRRGTAFPFPLGPDVVELAPVVMDSTLIHHRGMNPDAAWKACIELMDRVEATGGAFVAIWHPNNMDDYLFPGWGDVLYDLCREASRRGAATERPTSYAFRAQREVTRLTDLFTKEHQ